MSRAPSFAAAFLETLQAAVGAATGAADPPRPAELFALLKRQRFRESLELLQQHPQLWAARDEGGHSPLHWAALGGCVDFARSAAAAGVPVDVQPSDRQTPLMWAVFGGDSCMVEALLDARADPSVRDSHGATLLIVAIQQGHHAAARLLADRGGAEMLAGGDRGGCTAAHWAAHLGDLGSLTLLEALRAELQALDAYGMSPLHRAVDAGRLGAVGFLLDRGADPTLRHAGGASCVDIAVESPDRRLQAVLLRSAFRRQLRQRGGAPFPTSPTASGAGGDVADPLRIAHWAPMAVGVAACWPGGGAATPPEPRQVSEASGEKTIVFKLEGCKSHDELLQALTRQLSDSSDSAVCLWAADHSGKAIDLLSSAGSSSLPGRLPAEVHLFPVGSGGSAAASRTAALDCKLTWHMSASPGAYHGRVFTLVPPDFRWEVWKEMLQLHARDLPSSNAYRELARPENEWTQLVKADAHRTFKGFDEEQRACLMRVLNAYAAYNSSVGYCQGMNRLAGLLLLLSGREGEEECFGVLVCLMDRLGLAEFFRDGFPLLHGYVEACNQLLEERAPDLLRHFSREGVEPDMYLRQWFLTLFIDCLPLPLVVSVWDAIIRHGLSFALRVAVALLESMKETLLGLQYPALTDALKALRDSSAASRGEDSLWLGHLLTEYASSVVLPEDRLVK